jgi:hypothetical protein
MRKTLINHLLRTASYFFNKNKTEKVVAFQIENNYKLIPFLDTKEDLRVLFDIDGSKAIQIENKIKEEYDYHKYYEYKKERRLSEKKINYTCKDKDNYFNELAMNCPYKTKGNIAKKLIENTTYLTRLLFQIPKTN